MWMVKRQGVKRDEHRKRRKLEGFISSGISKEDHNFSERKKELVGVKL